MRQMRQMGPMGTPGCAGLQVMGEPVQLFCAMLKEPEISGRALTPAFHP